MSFVFAAIVPHNPALIPAIGKDPAGLFPQTSIALSSLAEHLIAKQLDTLLLCTIQNTNLGSYIGLNGSRELNGDFAEFGDLVTKVSATGDSMFAFQLNERLKHQQPMRMYISPILGYAETVPLSILQVNQIKIVPCTIGTLTPEVLFASGKALRHECEISSKRIGVIFSMHFSHSENTTDTESVQRIDTALIDGCLAKPFRLDIVSDEQIHDARITGLPGLHMLAGMVSSLNYTPNLHSYEHVLGTGHVVLSMEVQTF